MFAFTHQGHLDKAVPKNALNLSLLILSDDHADGLVDEVEEPRPHLVFDAV